MSVVFEPINTGGLAAPAGASSASVAFTAGGNCLKVTNTTNTADEHAFFRVGNGTQTTVVTDCQIGPGETIYVAIRDTDDNIATLQSTGAQDIWVTPGRIIR